VELAVPLRASPLPAHPRRRVVLCLSLPTTYAEGRRRSEGARREGALEEAGLEVAGYR
jgi:hypothetical protein